MMPKSMKTPEERSEVIERANRRARKSYRTNIKKRRGGITEDELRVMSDQLVSLRLVGYTNSQCASIIGLSKGQVREIASDENFQKRLKTLREKLPQAAQQLGQAYLVEAVQWVVDVGRTTKDDDRRLKAAAELFDRFGIPKTSRVESKDETEKPADDGMPESLMGKLRSASPEVQEKVAELQESFFSGIENILSGGTDGIPE